MPPQKRVCPACQRELVGPRILTIKRKPPLPPTQVIICTECHDTASNVLRLIQPYYPEQLIFPAAGK